MVGGGVDAHQIAAAVDQGSSGVAFVDGGVGLQQILPAVAVRPHAGEADAAGGADDALGDGLADVVGVADGEHHVPHVRQPIRILRDHRQVVRLDVEHRQISQLVGANQLGAEHPAILQGDDDLIRVGDDVIVGQHVAALVHDDAGAQSLRPEFDLLAAIAGETAGINVDDGRAGAMGCVGEAQFTGIGDEARQVRASAKAGKQQQQECSHGEAKADRLAQVTDQRWDFHVILVRTRCAQRITLSMDKNHPRRSPRV